MVALSSAILILAAAARAQQTPAKDATAAAGSPCALLARGAHQAQRDVCANQKDAKAATLKRITLAPVNPMALAKAIRPPATKSSRKVSDGADSTVTEFQAGSGEFPAAGDSSAFACGKGSTRRVGKQLCATSSKGKFFRDVHGEAYGALAPGLDGGHAAGAAVGASSKAGKTHIFIETNHSRDSSSR